MIETQDREIGENVYRVEPLGAKKGLEVFSRLFALLAPALSGVFAGDVKGLGDLPLESIARGLAAVAKQGLATDLEYFVAAFWPKTKIRPAGAADFGALAPVAEVIFAGRISDLLQVIWFNVEVNYSDFLSVFASMRPPPPPAKG